MTSWRAYYWVAKLFTLSACACVRALVYWPLCVYCVLCLCVYVLLINMHCHTEERDKRSVGVGAGVSHWLSFALAARQLIRRARERVCARVCVCVCAGAVTDSFLDAYTSISALLCVCNRQLHQQTQTRRVSKRER